MLAAAALLAGGAAPSHRPGWVDAARLAAADSEPGEWFTGGRDGAGSYHSPLTGINAGNAGRLGFAWEYQLGTARGLQATPVVVDGRMYVSGNWGRVYALDAATGRELWTFDPKVDGAVGRDACCDVVNRGVALWRGRVYVGALDGRLFALDARTGRPAWTVDTIERGRGYRYTSTGAPQIAGDVVVIGNAGADFGARGYVTAYDLATGARRWRFHTVPRDPRRGPPETAALARAARTWDPSGDWSRGGGGTVWDGMAYDPRLDLLYLGTGNGAAYRARGRSPRGGDNLYLASILAIRARTGELVWHYQTVPGDNWDYTATQKFILADLAIGGRRRAVLMQAPKNGFFYVLDRATGEVLSARPHGFVNWTAGLDPATSRPRPNPQADYSGGAALVYPGMAGAHNWQPMAYNPATGLVYIPAIGGGMVFINLARRPVGHVDGTFDTLGLPPEDYAPDALKSLLGPLPSMAELVARAGGPKDPRSTNTLRAWDPVRNRVAWERTAPGWWEAGGVATTAGNLVLRGTASGHLEVFAADTGRPLARVDLGTSVIAAPMTYRVGGIQYVAVLAGYGGGGGFLFPPGSAAHQRGNAGRVIVLKLGGGPVPKPDRLPPDGPFDPPARFGAPAIAALGERLYVQRCSRCHVFGRGLVPDLRRSAIIADAAAMRAVVIDGALRDNGMASFADVLTPGEVESIRAYLVDAANAAEVARVNPSH